jgi:integrase
MTGLKIMMRRRQVEDAALFYEFSLEKHGPPDHQLRSIDRFVDLQQIRRDLAVLLTNDGIDTRAIQDWLGHVSITHTTRYRQLSTTRFKDFWR